MNYFFIFAFLFALGGSFGWVLELFFRRIFTAKKWINPGFLVGPFLPLYGFGLCFLYGLSLLNLSFVENGVLRAILHILLLGLAMTFVEYVAGKIFIVGMHVKLWDYSDQPGNIEGIICPLFSLFWTLIGAGYYFFLHGKIVLLATNFSIHSAFLFPLGMFFGIFLIDFFYSAQILARIRKFAKENDLVVKLEELKSNVGEKLQKNRFFGFVFVLRTAVVHGGESLKEYGRKLSEQAKNLTKKHISKER